MSNKIKRIGWFLALALFFAMSGCTKTTTVIIDNSPEVTGTVLFAKDIVPILTKSCVGSGCHSGSVAPNLTEASAFNTLVNGNFINTATPANSEVYLWLTGKRSVAMPVGSANNPSNLNALMLAWIKQGAKNK